MTEPDPASDAPLDSRPWALFLADLPTLRPGIERSLRLAHAYDARRDDALDASADLSLLVDDAVSFAEDHRDERPAGVSCELWLRKLAMSRLDDELERRAAASGGLYRSWTGTSELLLAESAHRDPVERRLWLDAFGRAAAGAGREPVPDALDAAEERQRLRDLEHALLRLPEFRRRVVLHDVFDGLDGDDIAYLLDATVEHVEEERSAGRRGLAIELAL